MKTKSFIRMALLIFVFASVVFLLFSELRSAINPVSGKENGVAIGEKGPTHQVIAYYFHGTVRCSSCKKIEAWAQEAIERDFSTELKAGTLQWQVINIDMPENEHFVKDYQLFTRSLVLVTLENGKVTGWTNLKKVWTLLDEKPAFANYVKVEIEQYLNLRRS